MSIKPGDAIKFVVRAIAYQAIEIKAVNSLLSRITGADIKEKLAEKVLADVFRLAPGYLEKTNSKMLGERTPEIVSVARDAFFSNTQKQTEEKIGDLVKLVMASKGQGKMVQDLAGNIVTQLVPTSQLGDNTAQKILYALKQQEGGKNILKMAVENAFSGATGGKMLSSVVMSVLNHAILDNAKYEESTWAHQVAAFETHNYLLGSLQAQQKTEAGIAPEIATRLDKHVLPTAPTGWEAMKTTGVLASDVASFAGASSAIPAALQVIDFTKNIFGIAPQPSQPANTTFTDAWESDMALDLNTPLQDFAALAVKAHTLDNNARLQHEKTKQKGAFVPKYGPALTRSIEALPEKSQVYFKEQRQQIDALYQRWPGAEMKVALTWAGGLAAVSANDTKSYPVAQSFLDSKISVAGEPEKIGNYAVNKNFLSHFQKGEFELALNGSQSKTGVSATAASWGSWSFLAVEKYLPGSVKNPLDGFSATQQQQLEQLSQIVDGDLLRLPALTAYLNPDYLLAGNPLDSFKKEGTDLICVDNVWLKLGKPEVSFTVNKEANKDVNIQAQLTWPILESGQSPQTLQSSKEQTGSVTVNTAIQFLKNGEMVREINKEKTAIQIERQEKLAFSWSELPPSAPPPTEMTKNEFD